MHKDQMRSLIEKTLADAPLAGLADPRAVELLMLTAAVESNLGEYIEQLGGGPALGVFQMEPATERDIWVNWLSRADNMALRAWAASYTNSMTPYEEVGFKDLEFNLAYQVAMTRLHFYRSPKPLPEANAMDLALYWKELYNTPKGAGSVVKAVRAYSRAVV